MRTEATHSLLRALAHPLASFHPRRMPAFMRRSYQLELFATLFLSIALAMVDGALTGVIVKKAFEDIVPKARLDYIVAILVAAPEFTNVSSFLWARLGHGRRKVRIINLLQGGLALLVAAMALTPRTEPGLYLYGACMIAARVCFAGIVTLRVSVWRANYPRTDRARITGKLAIIQSLIIGTAGLLVGFSMNRSADSFRVIFPLAALIGVAGMISYGNLRVRRERVLLREEKAVHDDHRPSLSPLALYRTLAADRHYALYMLWMFVFGSGNLMLNAPLIITLREQFKSEYAGSVIVMQTIPFAAIVLCVPLWARLLDRVHVVPFRCIHSWFWVSGQALVLAASVSHFFPLMYAGMSMTGVGLAGGALAWNLGHLDFAPAHKAGQYMAVHLTLNGVRGLLAPLFAIFLMGRLHKAHADQWVFAVSVVFCVVGALGFMHLRRVMGPTASGKPRDITGEETPEMPVLADSSAE